MKTIKQILLTIAVLLFSLTAKAYDFEVDGICYNILSVEDLTVEVIRNNHQQYSGEVIIPSTVEYQSKTLTVVSIGESAFEDCVDLTGITIPSSVTLISDYAFENCISLRDLYIEDGEIELLIKRGEYFNKYWDEYFYEAMFYDCPLENIYLGRNLSYDESEDEDLTPFAENSNIKTVTIGNGVTKIGNYLFYSCENLTCINLPNSVTSIGDKAFNSCDKLTIQTIPNSVTNIGKWAFARCSFADTEVIIPSGVKIIKDGVFAFTNITSIDIHNSVTKIGYYAFEFCEYLESIDIPNSVISIGDMAFYNSSIDDFRIEDGEKTLSLGNSVFEESHLSDIYIGRNLSSSSLFQNAYISTVTIGNNVTNIGDGMCSQCSHIANIFFMGPNPPLAEEDDFADNIIINTALNVPQGTIDIYKSAEGWKNFWNIQEHDLVEYYKVVYMVDGDMYNTQYVAYGDSIPVIDAPTKEGYTFSGWSEIPETMPAHDVTVNGTFSINSYDLIYIVDGEEYKRVTLEFGSEITPEEEPTKEGYTFSGWSEIPETMPAHDVEVTGSFISTENVSELEFDVNIQITNNGIILLNAYNSAVRVYTVNGILVEKIDKYSGEEIILNEGVYIVCVGNTTMKIKL